MKTSKIKIKNLLSIKDLELDGKSVELIGQKGAGKSSVLDAFRAIFTNNIDRDVLVRQGENKAEILLETDTGLSIDREYNKMEESNDVVKKAKIKENGKPVSSPETFLRELFTPLQLDPIKFTEMSRQEQNRMILNLIEFEWDTNWIEEKFGELPSGIDYSKHILEVLDDIQSKKGNYYKERQLLNSEILHQRKSISDIASDIPANYQVEKWSKYDLDVKYEELNKAQILNGHIDRAKMFKESYDNKVRGLEADKQIKENSAKEEIESERVSIANSIVRMKAEIKALESKQETLDETLAQKMKVIHSEFNEAKAQLDKDTGVASEYAGKEKTDTTELQDEINTAKEMMKHLNEYNRMEELEKRVAGMTEQSDEYTKKIELARELPSEILKTAKIPVKGLTVENGIPLVNGLPISNLSSGEQLDLCVDVTISKYGVLKIILIDGVERLDTKAREELYKKCKDKGVQIIATRTTDDEELTVIEL